MFSNFEIPMFYRYEYYMSISHIALIVNMVHKCQKVWFDPYIGRYREQPLRVRVDLGAMVMKEYSAFPRAPVLLTLTIKLFNVIYQDTRWWVVSLFCWDAVTVIYNASRLGQTTFKKRRSFANSGSKHFRNFHRFQDSRILIYRNK